MGILARGSTGEFVTQLQQRLKEWGFYEGEPTGSFDEETDECVALFQEQSGLAADGVAGLVTLEALGLTDILFAPDPQDSTEA